MKMETNNTRLTDDEVVKALKICGTYKGKCTDCPAFVKVDRSNCKKVLLGAVEIINRQNADLENYKQIAENQQSVSMDKEVEIKRLRAEVERWKELCEEWKAVAYKTADEKDEIYCNAVDRAKTAKAEAVKEFARRLKSYLHEEDFETPDERWKPESEFADLIDNLLKEKVGEDK